MEIKGLQKTSLIDYPGKISSVVFLGGCNFRCGFCFNSQIVLKPESVPTIPEEKFFEEIGKRKGFIDGIVVTGGEPTIHKELPAFLGKIKKEGFLVKLDTNGSNPEMLEELLEGKLVDFIAMDIKTSFKKYALATGGKAEEQSIKKSIKIIMQKASDYEFRTTVVPEFYSKEDALEAGTALKGAKKYCLQQFVREADLIDKSLKKKNAYLKEELEELARILKQSVEKVEIRGT